MKLLRYLAGDQIKPGILDKSGAIRDLSAIVPDIDADTVTPEGLAEIALIDPESLPRVVGSPVLAPPVASPSKVVCIGLNYSDHAAEVARPLGRMGEGALEFLGWRRWSSAS